MIKLVWNFPNEKFRRGFISIFFSRYCLAVKVAARSRYPKGPFEFKDTTHNPRLVAEPGEGVREPAPLLTTAPSAFYLNMLSSVEEDRCTVVDFSMHSASWAAKYQRERP